MRDRLLVGLGIGAFVVLLLAQLGGFWYTASIHSSLDAKIDSLDAAFKSADAALDQRIIDSSVLLNNRVDALSLVLQNTSDTLSGRIDSARFKLEEENRVLSHNLQNLERSTQETKEQLEQSIRDIEISSDDLAGVVQKALPSVVSVLTNKGQGSGAIVTTNGLVITNYHVIEGATSVSVLTSSGERFGVELVGTAEDRDLAILKIISDKTFKKLSFNHDHRQGQTAIVIGNPGGLGFTVTEGIVSATADTRNVGGLRYIQISAPINPGNSGGPVINSKGEIIGIATLKLSGFEGVGFAIPADEVESIVDQAKKLI